MHTCASDLQVNPTRKQTDIALLPRCIALLSPPPCHPTCLQTCRFITRIITVARPVFANGSMLQNKRFREERHKEGYSSMSLFLNAVHCCGGSLTKVTRNETIATMHEKAKILFRLDYNWMSKHKSTQRKRF